MRAYTHTHIHTHNSEHVFIHDIPVVVVDVVVVIDGVEAVSATQPEINIVSKDTSNTTYTCTNTR